MGDAEKEVGALRIDEMLGELESIVGQLEAGELSLEEALSVYARGMVLCGAGRTQLAQAEQTIERLSLRGMKKDHTMESHPQADVVTEEEEPTA